MIGLAVSHATGPNMTQETMATWSAMSAWSRAAVGDVLEGYNAFSGISRDLSRSLAASTWSAVDAWAAVMPIVNLQSYQPKVEWASFLPAIDFASLITPIIPSWFEGATGQVSELLDSFGARRKRDLSADTLPPNLRAFATTPESREHLNDLLLKEALPLAYAMSEATVAAILSEPDAGARRERLWSRRAGILATCEEQLTTIRAEHLQHKAELAWQSVQAFREGLHGPAQAQAIALMDTHFTIDASIELEDLILKNRKPHAGLWKLQRRSFPVLAPISAVFNRRFNGQVHKHGRPRQQVPRDLSRHATVHGAEARQYSKRNALLSIAMVTGLLCLLQDEHSRAAFTRS